MPCAACEAKRAAAAAADVLKINYPAVAVGIAEVEADGAIFLSIVEDDDKPCEEHSD